MADNKIIQCFKSGREFVKQNNLPEAIKCVDELLSFAYIAYKKSNDILTRAKTKSFFIQWYKVRNDMIKVGVTNYVLESFGLDYQVHISDNNGEKDCIKVPEAPLNEEPLKNDGSEIDIGALIVNLVDWNATLFKNNKRAIVRVSATHNDGSGSSGTGFIISQNGYFLTCDHIIFDKEADSYYPKVKILFDGEKKKFNASVIISNREKDIALCSFDPDEVGEFTTVHLIDDYSSVEFGTKCVVIGNSFNNGLNTIDGNVRYPHSHDDNNDLIFAAQTNYGDSGGPVINRNGEVIGINKSTTTTINGVTVNGFCNATPADEIKKLLDKWIKANNIEL